MAINREQIRAQYEAAQKAAEKAREEYIAREAVPTPAEAERTFRERMEARIGEVSPETRRAEARIFKRFMTAPTRIREEMAGTVISPLEKEKIVSGRMQGWLDELEGIRDLREQRSEDIADMIRSIAVGYRAEIAKKRAEMEQMQEYVRSLETAADDKWREYQQSYREYNDALNRSITRASLTERDRARQSELIAQARANLAEAGLKTKDGMVGVDTYMNERNRFINEMGWKNRGMFDAMVGADKYLNFYDPVIVQDLKDRKDFNIDDMSDRAKSVIVNPYIGLSQREKEVAVYNDVKETIQSGEYTPEEIWDYITNPNQGGMLPPDPTATGVRRDLWNLFAEWDEGQKFLEEGP